MTILRYLDSGVTPLSRGVPPLWASAWGEDKYGIFADLEYAGVAQRCRWMRPAKFVMGSPEDEVEHLDREGTRQEITFAQGFWLFDTAVTQELYEAVMGENPSGFKGDNRPVEQVSWNDAQSFLQRLGERVEDLHPSLPSESEWEYACRAGSETPFEPTVAHWQAGRTITPDEANYDGNFPYADGPKGVYRQKTVPVKHSDFRPNAWGLWQMHGNVWEWCADEWINTLVDIPADGSLRQSSKQDSSERLRVVRGGSWSGNAGICRSACRNGDWRDNQVINTGFRCVLRLGP